MDSLYEFLNKSPSYSNATLTKIFWSHTSWNLQCINNWRRSCLVRHWDFPYSKSREAKGMMQTTAPSALCCLRRCSDSCARFQGLSSRFAIQKSTLKTNIWLYKPYFKLWKTILQDWKMKIKKIQFFKNACKQFLFLFPPSVDKHFKTTEFSSLIKTCRNSITCTCRWKVTCSPTVN